MNKEAPEVKNDSDAQILCKRGCGFYGSVQFKDMCSKCYQEQIKHEAGIQQTSLVRPNAAELSETHDRISSRLEHPAASADTGLTTTKISNGSPIRSGCDGATSQGSRSLKRKADSPVPQPTEFKFSASSTPRVNRCSWCRKRVGLTGFLCRCENLFCSLHRYSDQHECSYDYQAHGRIELAKANPEVRCPKIRKL
ncbi:Zinc finger A20 and AN1 domain-containing stress-associated protein 8 [Fasciola gigantica]|uniref:Zinc finger A20 and AN1 domain-containing stress-associated protein 8 n=1 Tax=Fasciola gigantica TaxID=46835 RepID=A0A504Z126_FASGI|nr:Zinc finger A20 and AN1 domain-containing stress-associated protein 8 [Fasciola gigantica]